MLYEKRMELEKKYAGVVKEICQNNRMPNGQEYTTGAAFDVLCYMAREGAHDAYKGVPAGFDWIAFANEIKGI